MARRVITVKTGRRRYRVEHLFRGDLVVLQLEYAAHNLLDTVDCKTGADYTVWLDAKPEDITEYSE